MEQNTIVNSMIEKYDFLKKKVESFQKIENNHDSKWRDVSSIYNKITQGLVYKKIESDIETREGKISLTKSGISARYSSYNSYANVLEFRQLRIILENPDLMEWIIVNSISKNQKKIRDFFNAIKPLFEFYDKNRIEVSKKINRFLPIYNRRCYIKKERFSKFVDTIELDDGLDLHLLFEKSYAWENFIFGINSFSNMFQIELFYDDILQLLEELEEKKKKDIVGFEKAYTKFKEEISGYLIVGLL